MKFAQHYGMMIPPIKNRRITEKTTKSDVLKTTYILGGNTRNLSEAEFVRRQRRFAGRCRTEKLQKKSDKITWRVHLRADSRKAKPLENQDKRSFRLVLSLGENKGSLIGAPAIVKARIQPNKPELIK